MIEALAGAGLLAVGVMLGWWLRDRTYPPKPDAAVGVALSSAVDGLVDLAGKAFIARGLPAHIVDPDTFTPEGISYRERDAVETKAVDIQEITTETEDEMKRQLDALLARSK